VNTDPQILTPRRPAVHLTNFRVIPRRNAPLFAFDYQLACYDDGVGVILTPLEDGTILELCYHSGMPVENLDHPYRVFVRPPSPPPARAKEAA
jgi:hypothetical protein